MNDLPKGSFRLEGYIDVPVDRVVEQIHTALPEHIRLTREEEGCIFFNVDPCPNQPGRFLVSEAFTDQEAFKHHQERAGSSDWATQSPDIPRDYRTWVVE